MWTGIVNLFNLVDKTLFLLWRNSGGFDAFGNDFDSFLQVFQTVVHRVTQLKQFVLFLHKVTNLTIFILAKLYNLALFDKPLLLLINLLLKLFAEPRLTSEVSVHLLYFISPLKFNIFLLFYQSFDSFIALDLMAVICGVIRLFKWLCGKFRYHRVPSDVDFGFLIAPLCRHILLVFRFKHSSWHVGLVLGWLT